MRALLSIVLISLFVYTLSGSPVYAESSTNSFLAQGGQQPAQPPAHTGNQPPGGGETTRQPPAAQNQPQEIQVMGHEIPAVTPIANLPEAFNRVIRIIFTLVGVIAFLYLIYAGFQYLTAGSSDAAENAKKTIVNTIIGIVIFFLSLAIVTGVINALSTGRLW